MNVKKYIHKVIVTYRPPPVILGPLSCEEGKNRQTEIVSLLQIQASIFPPFP